jgi:chromosome segregation ATPase
VKDPESGNVVQLECPCCRRRMELPDVEVFQTTMKDLASNPKFVEADPGALERKATYQTMRKAVESKVDDLRDFRRMTGEAGELEKEIKRLQDEVYHCTASLKNQSDLTDDAQQEVNKLRALCDTIRRWTDDANRVAEKKMQIQQMKMELESVSATSTRDLKTVDRELTELREEKESLANKILRLNKEMSEVNLRISEISTQVRW